MTEHPRTDWHRFDLGQFERERAHDMALLRLGQRAEMHPRLAIVVGKAFGTDAQLVALLVFGVLRCERAEAAIRDLARADRIEAVRLVRDTSGRHILSLQPIALEIVHWAARAVDLQLVEIRSAEAKKLRVGIGEQASLQ